MKKVIHLFKPVSYTPLQVVEKFREEHPPHRDARLGYAGRLDPMASGVLVVLVNEENFQRKKYELLNKEYEFEVLFGLRTDTYDVMGRIAEVRHEQVVHRHEVLRVMQGFCGSWEQEYPSYSSVRVSGRPLYWWARSGRLSEVSIPSKKVHVHEMSLSGMSRIRGKEVALGAIARISPTKGEFRQKEILSDWNAFLETHGEEQFFVANIHVSCSSGVYVRGVASEMGKMLGVPALAHSITRTRVGPYDLSSSLRIGSING